MAVLSLATGLVLAATSTSSARSTDCKPVTVVFYESSDWARLAAGLGADYSPCADYYVTIPALAADKTQLVAGRAPQVRAYGPNFHALAEVNYNAWQRWVTSTGNSWYQAGQQLRDRMRTTGFDISTGDTWAVNELQSSVRANTGAARQNIRDFVHGLYDGTDGPPLKGIVYVVGVGQNGVSLPTYKATLESWLQDAPFWSDMSTYVSGFYQEAYGDVRNYAASGVDPTTRIGLQNAFLQQLLSLAVAPNAPATAATAKDYLQNAYGPLANASWGWASAYGWTQVATDIMADYISAQTAAMRTTGEAHIGFAWNPLNSTGLSQTDYVNGIAGVLARLVGSIHETDGGDPNAACEATGCNVTITGAQTAPGWGSFATWTPTTANFTTPPLTLTVGVPSGPINLQLQTGTVPAKLPFDSTVTVSSSSPTTTFATAPTGPFAPTLTLPLAAGANTAAFYAEDTTTGQPTFTTNVNGVATATQVESIAPVPSAAPPPPPPPPPPATLTPVVYEPIANHLHVRFQVVDANGAPLQGRVRVAVLLGTTQIADAALTTAADGTVSLTAFPQLALGCYSVKIAAVTVPGHVWDGTASTGDYCVKTLPMSVGGITIGKRNGHLRLGVRVVDVSGRPLAANVSVVVLRGGVEVASSAGPTASNGWYSLTASPKINGEACFSVQVRTVKAAGRTWDKLHGTKYACLHGPPAAPAGAKGTPAGRRRG